MSPRSAVVLLSGGLDSTTTLAMAQSEGFLAYAMTFRYGQRQRHEVDLATRIAEQYGVDWTRIGDLKSIHRAACGYGRPAKRVQDTVTALKGIPLTCGALINPYNTQVDEAVIPLTVARLLRRSLDGTGGVLVYDRLPMDGRCLAFFSARLGACHVLWSMSPKVAQCRKSSSRTRCWKESTAFCHRSTDLY